METDHWHKMQAEDGVWITLDGLHMGVGGDDSWTPSVLPQWLLSQTRWQYEVSLRCFLIRGGDSPHPTKQNNKGSW